MMGAVATKCGRSDVHLLALARCVLPVGWRNKPALAWCPLLPIMTMLLPQVHNTHILMNGYPRDLWDINLAEEP